MKQLLLFVLTGVLLFAQCKKDNSTFDMPYIVEMEIPAGIPPFPFQNIETLSPVLTRSTTIFEGYGYTAADIQQISASSVRLTITFPAGSDFAFLEKAFLLIRGEDGVEAEIGYLEYIPTDQGALLDFIPSTTDVTDILKGTYFDVILKMEPRYSPTQFIRFRLNLEFNAFVS